jgi:hypothetical protein
MATASQIAANIANAQKSTGPKTDAGKVTSSRNRLSHGFESTNPIMPGEDPEAFKALLADFMAEHRPGGATEQVLVEKMAVNQWLSLRAVTLQSEAFLAHMLSAHGGAPKDLGLFIRYHSTAERAFHKAHNELVKAQKERKKSEIGFEPQTVAEAAPAPPPEPETEPEPPLVIPIRPEFSAKQALSVIKDTQFDFEIDPEILEYLKNVA